MKENLNEWKTIPSLWMRKLDIFKDGNSSQQGFSYNLTN